MLDGYVYIHYPASWTHPSRLRKDSRAAVLASKRAIDAQSRSQREELLRSPSVREQVMSSNEKVTFVSSKPRGRISGSGLTSTMVFALQRRCAYEGQ